MSNTKAWKQMKAIRQANGLCVQCGEKLPDGWTITHCPKCNARLLELRQLRKQRNKKQREEARQRRKEAKGKTLPPMPVTWQDDPSAYAPKQGIKPEPLNTHKCVDCGALTPDHRCPKCLAKWRAKHKVRSDGGYSPTVYTVRF